jgi:hypothetical protein
MAHQNRRNQECNQRNRRDLRIDPQNQPETTNDFDRPATSISSGISAAGAPWLARALAASAYGMIPKPLAGETMATEKRAAVKAPR